VHFNEFNCIRCETGIASNLTASDPSKRQHTSVRRDGMNGHVGVNEQGDANPDFANASAPAKATGTSAPLTHNASVKVSANKAKSAKATNVDLNMAMKSDKKLRYDCV